MYPGDAVCAIKDGTLQGYINERDAGRYSFAKATTRRTAANSPNREFFSGNASRLGAVCEIDSTKLDVQVWDDKGNVFRPTATVLFDVASRVPLAWALHADAPNGFDHALLLARAIVGRRAIPGSPAAVLSGSATLPVELIKRVNPYLDDDSLAVPWIFPHAITVDGGADYRSATFEAACRERLSALWTDPAIDVWLTSANAHLAGARPSDMLALDGLEPVMEAIEIAGQTQ